MDRQKIDIAFSPCPNDTFIFHNLVQTGTAHLNFTAILEDVAELNRRAMQESRHAISKLSFFAMSLLNKEYRLLDCGGALGRACGPLWISRTQIKKTDARNSMQRVLIPGTYTTANLLLHLYLTDQGCNWRKIEFIPMRYDRIMPALLDGKADYGLIIHEERFGYQKLGLHLLQDLGEWWEISTGHPIPLGCIAVRKDISKTLQSEIEAGIRTSLSSTRGNPAGAWSYIKEHAQAMDDHSIQSHIDLYVNDFSLEYGPVGHAAIAELFRRAGQAGLQK